MAKRTSDTHPIKIATIKITTTPISAKLGITFCPGKKSKSIYGEPWDRNLDLDLDEISAWGTHTLITLLEPHELRELQVEQLGQKTNERGMRWIHMPIKDISIPTEEFELLWQTHRTHLLNTLKSGRSVVVHCRGGLGRAGTIGARILIELGYEPRDAIKAIRNKRPGAIETPEQASYVLNLKNSAKSKSENWFKSITGFSETDYKSTQKKISVIDGFLYVCKVNTGYRVGNFQMFSLPEIRSQIPDPEFETKRSSIKVIQGDVRELHSISENNLSLFQVASQFNCLEMVDPSVTPEDGVLRYEHDNTQGPACAIAAGAATIYRNYLIDSNGKIGQSANKQLDCSNELKHKLAEDMGVEPNSLWGMKNGYAIFTNDSLLALHKYLTSCDPNTLASYKDSLRIGLQTGASVTDIKAQQNQLVSQAFSSALPISYHQIDEVELWGPITRLILCATYRLTLNLAVLNRLRTGNRKVFLTLVGCGAFQNPKHWVYKAVMDEIKLVINADLDIHIVSYEAPDPKLLSLVSDFAQ